MELDILTRQDVAEFTALLATVHKEVIGLKKELSAYKNKTIGSAEIMERLKISYNTFQLRRTELCTFGMYKNGGWKMELTHLDNYIESKK